MEPLPSISALPQSISRKAVPLRRWYQVIVLGALSTVIAAPPTFAANAITFLFGPIRRSLSVDSLADFAQTGTPNPELRSYLRFAKADTPETKVILQNTLTRPIDLNPAQLSRILESNIGERILTSFGQYVQQIRGDNGNKVIRAGMVLAASQPEGLTLLNVLQNIPTNIQVDLQAGLALSKVVNRIAKTTEFGINEVTQLATAEAKTQTQIDPKALPDLRQPGPLQTLSYRMILTDTSRQRQFNVIIHRPQTWSSKLAPVVVFSHGLGASPNYFKEQANHLASYGYVVAVPQHIGSDAEQAQRFRQGYAKDFFRVNEFLDRPRDVSFLLDELERRNQRHFAGKLDLKRVGVGGHSFGGYTALAVGGAKIDFDNLAQDCSARYSFLNTSTLLQCQALKLPRRDYDLRDPRVEAVFAINPVNSSIFGPQGLATVQVPVLLGGGGYDPATPFVFEQARSFLWLKAPTKYLGLIPSQTHIDITSLDAGFSRMLASIPGLVLIPQEQIDLYGAVISTAFFNTHVLNDVRFRPYLTSSYAAFLSQGQVKANQLSLISAASQPQFEQAIDQFRQQEQFSAGQLLY